MIPTLSGLLGLPWVGKHRLTSVSIHLVLVILLSLLHSFQTTCIWEVKSIGIVPVHVLKVPLKYWGMLPKLSGPLGLKGQSCGHHSLGWQGLPLRKQREQNLTQRNQLLPTGRRKRINPCLARQVLAVTDLDCRGWVHATVHQNDISTAAMGKENLRS